MSGSFTHDFNGADAQQSAFDLIPSGTVVKVRLTIRPGGVGPEGWVTQSRTSDAQYLNTEAVVLDGPHARRRIYTRIGLRGKGGAGADDAYGNRGRSLIRGILESARGIASKDSSDRARAARVIRGYGDLNGLEFVARIGIDKDKSTPTDEGRNSISAAIGPDHPDYARVVSAVPVMAAPHHAGMAAPPHGAPMSVMPPNGSTLPWASPVPAGAPPAATAPTGPASDPASDPPFWAR